MEEILSKAEELLKKRNERYKRTYKYFTYAFYIHISLFILALAVGKSQTSDLIILTWFALWIISGLAYIMFLGTLVSGANKSSILWVGGTIVFNYIGFFVSFVRMKPIAIEEGWTK